MSGFPCDSTTIDPIAIWRLRDETGHHTASFTYRLCRDLIRTPILNWSNQIVMFEGLVWCGIPLQRSSFVSEPDQEPNWEFGHVASTTQCQSPIASLHSLDHSLECISESTLSRSPIASTNLPDHGLRVYIWAHFILGYKCITKLAQSRPPSELFSSLDLSLQVHLHTPSMMASKYIAMEHRWVYGDRGVMEVEWAARSIYSGVPGVHRHHLIFISTCHTTIIQIIFPNFWFYSLFPRFCGSTQLLESWWPGSIIWSHLPMQLELELLFLTNSVWMLRRVWRNVDGGLSAFKLRLFTTMASKWCMSSFSQWASPGAPPIMLNYHLYIYRDT
jgi:hypothetical protein